MLVEKNLSKLDGVDGIGVVMATAHNKEVLKTAGLLTKDAEEAKPDDLVISVRCGSEEVAKEAFEKVDELLNKKKGGGFSGGAEVRPKTLDSALKQLPDANMVVISIPGKHAKDEVEKALDKNLNVMLFSDNVNIEDELYLKTKARDKGLLLMGPDCGTAIINNTALAFANVIRKGKIGIVGASGTGIQEVTVLINEFGGGISQAIGTGGRDLKEEIGGMMMLQGIELLNEDENTDVIVLISKPPSEKVVPSIIDAIKTCNKPVVVNFIGGEQQEIDENIYFASTLEAAAEKAVLLSGTSIRKDYKEVNINTEKLTSQQKYIRGLFSGGTLCYEALLVLRDYAHNVYSNTPIDKAYKLENANKAYQHTLLDLGEDEFTVGRPHPMIDMTLRAERIVQEAKDPETALLLMDVVLGYGSHENPVEELVPAIKKAKDLAAAEGRELPVVAYVCGTQEDPQEKQKQIEALEEAGVIITNTNAEAARAAGATIKSLEKLVNLAT
ncbi:MAG: acyl-CoA synthetase FdrA [Clostridiaceae bacterium]|nr:acyl-CoA synthetase FdrA [Clostridiaceae bacterium]